MGTELGPGPFLVSQLTRPKLQLVHKICATSPRPHTHKNTCQTKRVTSTTPAPSHPCCYCCCCYPAVTAAAAERSYGFAAWLASPGGRCDPHWSKGQATGGQGPKLEQHDRACAASIKCWHLLELETNNDSQHWKHQWHFSCQVPGLAELTMTLRQDLGELLPPARPNSREVLRC